jgi:hypothetical protein
MKLLAAALAIAAVSAADEEKKEVNFDPVDPLHNGEYPSILSSMRVKEHRSGAEGTLVEGEEHLLKVILKFTAVHAAEVYEVCHNCVIDDESGKRSGDEGDTDEIGLDSVCGGEPCWVRPGCPKSWNTFNVRAMVGDEWTRWSKTGRFLVVANEDTGHASHSEL